MPKFIQTQGAYKWAYVGEPDDMPRDLADCLFINEVVPFVVKDANKLVSQYAVEAILVDWQKTWVRVEDKREKD